MRSLTMTAALAIGCVITAFLFIAPPVTQGDEWNLSTRFTINHPFEVPGAVLQANTPYVMRLLDSPSNRNVVQIFNDDQNHLMTMFMAISDERLEPTDKTLFTFIETAPGYPLPMKEWFYPGRLRGLEFVYPKDQAQKIASHAREAVLASNSNDLNKLGRIKVESVGPIGTTTTVTETASINKSETRIAQEKPSIAESQPAEPVVEQQNVEQAPAEQPTEIAQNTEQQKVESEYQPEAAPTQTASVDTKTTDTEPRELPATAGELPLIALIGLLCLGAGLGFRVLQDNR